MCKVWNASFSALLMYRIILGNQNHKSLFITSLFILYSIFIFNNTKSDRPYSKLSISVNSLGRRKMEIKMTF